MQQSRDDFTKAKFTENDMGKDFPRKHYSKKELSILSEDSITWHPTSEVRFRKKCIISFCQLLILNFNL